MRRLVAAIIALQLTGCAGIFEANLDAVEALADDDSTSEDQGKAAAVLGGTFAAAVVLAIATSVGVASASSSSSSSASSPDDLAANELGWGLEQRDGKATWLRCTSRIFCTEQRVTVDAADLVESRKSGRVVPVAMGGKPIGEVDLYELRVRRRR